MNRNLAAGIAVMCALAATVPVEHSALAANEPGCSAQDQKVRSRYADATQQAILAGDTGRYQALQRELPASLSPSCRRMLNELEPVRVKCNAEEKELVLGHYQQVMQALSDLDVLSSLAILEELEDSVSPECWLATNRHIDPRVQNACSPAELDFMASLAGPAFRATERVLTSGDVGPLLEVAQELQTQLGPGCFQAVQALQQRRQSSPNQATPYQPSNVIDHGGGTYSVPGLGACSPTSGCVAY